MKRGFAILAFAWVLFSGAVPFAADLYPTPIWMGVYGSASFRGAALDKGDEVRVYAPGGALVGKFVVERTGAGEYGFLPIYGDDPYSKEKDGAGAGDVLRIALYRVSDGKEYPVLYSSVDPLPFKASMEGARVDLMF
ncbi:MAG: hypothetical protein ACYC7K_04955 [Desulfobacteria bacterium]